MKRNLLKTVIIILSISLVAVFQSCEKKGIMTQEEVVVEEVGVSEFMNEYEGQFKKEFTVSDKKGNTAFYVAYCNDENELNEFVNNSKFTLLTNAVDINDEETEDESELIEDIGNTDDTGEGITIVYKGANTKSDVKNISLNVVEKESNSKAKYYYRTYKTEPGNIYIKLTNNGRGFKVKGGYKKCRVCAWRWWSYKDYYNGTSRIIYQKSYRKVGYKLKLLTKYKGEYDYDIDIKED